MSLKSQELRKLMKKKTTSSKRINHSLAKYNQLDQLTCLICGTVIKNEIIWNAHLQSRKHKEKIASLKSNPKSNAQAQSEFKRPATVKPISEPVIKKNKSELPSDFFDSPITSKTAEIRESKPKGILKNKVEQTITKAYTVPTNTKTILPNNVKEQSIIRDHPVSSETALPSDFFDKNLAPSVNQTNQAKPKSISESEEDNEEVSLKTKIKLPTSSAEELPEGFFDDPKKDAKARNVEYVDPQDKEWEEFQKMIQEETKVAETIREEEDEESEMLKDMAEYNTMKSCLSRVNDLKLKLRTKSILNDSNFGNVQNKKDDHIIDEQIKEESDESDEDDINDLFNWRSKMA